MDNYAIVRQEHLTHHGYLFGGAMLAWVDEFAWLVASRDFPGCRLVTRAMNNIEFENSVVNGTILRFNILPFRQGETSITYSVAVFADEPGATAEKAVFHTNITFVHVDENGKKKTLPRKERLRSQW